MLKWPDGGNPVLLRTDFSDDEAWAALCKAAQAPSDEDFQANIDCVSNRFFDGLAVEQVVALAQNVSSHSFAFMADRLTVTDPERPILVKTPRAKKRWAAWACPQSSVRLAILSPLPRR